MNKAKKLILKNALKYLPKFGWSEELLDFAIKQTAKDIKKEELTIFSNIKDLVDFYLLENDELMLKELGKINPADLKIRDRIKTSLLIRFEQTPKEVAAETVKFLANPLNADLAFKSLARTCDKIWIWAGDQSTDFNYYSKRTLLGAVYSSSLIYYIKKENCTNKELENFITKRIENVLQIGGVKQKLFSFLRNQKG